MFKVGDYIRGLLPLDESAHNFTNERMIKGRVIDLDEAENEMKVELVTMREGFEECEGDSFWVPCNSREFAVIEPFKVGDFVKGLEDTDLLSARVIGVDENDSTMKIKVCMHKVTDCVGAVAWVDNMHSKYMLIQEPIVSIGDEMLFQDTKATVLAISNVVDWHSEDIVATLEWVDSDGDGRVSLVALHELVSYPELTLEELLEHIKENKELPGGDNSPEAYVKALRTVL